MCNPMELCARTTRTDASRPSLCEARLYTPQFSGHQESDLTTMVEERQLLWTIRDSKYHQRGLKENLLKVIATRIGLDFAREH